MKIQRLSWAGLKIECGDSYILIGKFNPPAPAGDWEWSTQSIDLTLTDRTGPEILYSYPDNIFPSYS